MQQPDGSVISLSGFKGKSSFSCDMSSVMSSSSSVPADYKKPPQLRRSSVISVDYDSDHSDSIINTKPSHNRNSGAQYVTSSDSPSTHSRTDPSFNFSRKTSTDLDGSELFSPKKPETVFQNKSHTPAASNAAEDMELDDFYSDDFDIDDFNASDIPDYFDEPPNSSTVTKQVTEVSMGSSKSPWDNKPTTPAPKPAKICSPGMSAWKNLGLYLSTKSYQVQGSQNNVVFVLFFLHSADPD